MRAVYSIKDLEKISGIKAHTIRIWERRYNIVEPKRTATNIRFYSDADLKRLLNISILNQNGIKISKIAHLDDEQLRGRVLDLCLDGRNNDVQIESMMIAMLDLDEHKFVNILSASIIKLGFEECMEQILFPFLDRIGVLWQTGSINPAQEHFISNLVRQKLIVAIDNEMQNKEPEGLKLIMFLPERELHELGLLFYNLMARKEGVGVIYLGVSVPLNDLAKVQELTGAHAFFTSVISAKDKEELEDLFQQYRETLPGFPFLVTGLQIKEHNPKLPEGFTVVSCVKGFKEAIRLLKYAE
jgi:DNA-binding transcriptional MerR regulator